MFFFSFVNELLNFQYPLLFTLSRNFSCNAIAEGSVLQHKIIFYIRDKLNKTKPCSGPAPPLYNFNVLTIIMQSLNIKEWNLFELQITHKQTT